MVKRTADKGNCWNNRNTLEKSLLVAFLFLICLVLALFIFLLLNNPSENFQGNNSNCLTSECIKAAGLIVDHIDPTVDPCDNFYNFVCGQYLRTALETEQVSPANKLQQVTQTRLNALITDPNTSDEVARPLRLQREFFQTCLNTQAIDNEANRNKFMRLVEKLGDWPVIKQRLWRKNDFSWLNFTMKCRHLGLDYDQFIRTEIKDDAEFTGLFLLSIHPPTIETIDDRLEAYYINLMTDIAVIMGAEAYPASLQLPGVLDLRKRLKSLVDDTDRNRTESTLKILELEQKIPWIPWLHFIKNITRGLAEIDENTYVKFYGEHYFRYLHNIIAKIPEHTQANYGIWTIIESFHMYLDAPIREKFVGFLSKAGEDVETRESFCLKKAESYFPLVTEIAYVRKYTTPAIIEDLTEMVEKMRKLIITKMKKSKWIDEETKIEAEIRLNRIEAFIGWSRNVFDEDFENITQLSTCEFNWPSDDILDMVTMLKARYMDENYEIINENYTEMMRMALVYKPELEVNAYYAPQVETLILPISILQGQFYDLSRPHYMNYGAIGSVIGHELTHGLTTQIISSENRILANWWSNQTLINFENVTKCLIEEYNDYPHLLTGFTKNGTAALDENLADFVGLNLAYEAYQDWVSTYGADKSLPGINYTPNQIFWIMSGTFKCYQPLMGSGEIVDGQPHGVPSFSVVGGLRNSPYFARDFNCALGTNMNPENKCIIL